MQFSAIIHIQPAHFSEFIWKVFGKTNVNCEGCSINSKKEKTADANLWYTIL